MTDPQTTEAAAIADLSAAPQMLQTIRGTEIMIVPRHSQHYLLKGERETPYRHTCRVILRNVMQLHAYLLANVDSDHRPVIFADATPRTFTAYLDYHKADCPSWLDHTAFVKLELSKQAKVWIQAQGKKFTQDELADFLEDNDADLTTQEMHNVAANFQAVRTETFRSSRRKDNGDFELTHNAQTASGGDKIITVPSEFKIAVPLFEGDAELTPLTCRLLHRVGEKGVTFEFKIHQLDRIIEASWKEVLTQFKESCKDLAEVFEGSAPQGDPVAI